MKTLETIKKINLANKLTILRLLLVVPFVLLLSNAKYSSGSRVIAAIIFIIASITDYLDGYIARREHLITDFGKLMDPLADKILVLAALIVFVEKGYIPSWMAIVIVSRDFLVSGIRMLAASKGDIISANMAGKIKTATQMAIITIIVLLGEHPAVPWLMLLPVILTVLSGWNYVKQGKHYFTDL